MFASASIGAGQHRDRRDDDREAQRLGEYRQLPACGFLPEHRRSEDHPGEWVCHTHGGQRHAQGRVRVSALVDHNRPGAQHGQRPQWPSGDGGGWPVYRGMDGGLEHPADQPVQDPGGETKREPGKPAGSGPFRDH